MDGAHAGVAAILPEQRRHFRGVELADSFNTNPHKWLLTTFDCSCIWFRDADPLKAALSLTPAYLRGKGNAYDFQVAHPPMPCTCPRDCPHSLHQRSPSFAAHERSRSHLGQQSLTSNFLRKSKQTKQRPLVP